jgi:hypothetical protein
MSTLAEIEAAVPNLNAQELEHLETRLREVREQHRAAQRQTQTDLAEFAGVLRLTDDPLDRQRRMRGEWE